MTYAQRNAIANPAAGLIVYCTDCANGEMQYYNGTSWINMSVGAASAPFTTPIVSTNTVTSISSNGAVSGGNITSSGGTNITARGICWSTTANPTISLTTKTVDGSGTGAFISTITGLTPSTTYYVRAYATNSVGTAYGTQQIFTTPSAVAVLPSVTIGTQVWTNKNLDVERYRNGDIIPQVTDPIQWAALTTGAWCWYNNDSATYAATYGRLYNWYAVNDARGMAPFGWHVPSDAEWNKLVKYLDAGADTTACNNCIQSTIAGGSMKSTTGWNAPNTGTTNSSGFSGLPGGYRFDSGTLFAGIGEYGIWWCSTEYSELQCWIRFLNSYDIGVDRAHYDKRWGFSVRCVRN
jgi:uncharacterized protein (TIGR02145 family)